MQLYLFVFQYFIVDEDNMHSDALISSVISTGKINLSRKTFSQKAESCEKLNFATEKRLIDGNGN